MSRDQIKIQVNLINLSKFKIDRLLGYNKTSRIEPYNFATPLAQLQKTSKSS